MKRSIIFAVALTLFEAGVGLTLAVPEPPYVSHTSLGGPGIRVEVSTCFPEGPYAGCDSALPPMGIEGANCR
jgi:hypothetical protein